MSSPDQAEWQHLREVLQNNSCLLAPAWVLIGAAIAGENLVRGHSVVADKLGLHRNLNEMSKHIHQIEDHDVEALIDSLNNYLETRGLLAGRFQVEDIPAHLVAHFDQVRAQVQQLVTKRRYFEALACLEAGYKQLQTLPDAKKTLHTTSQVTFMSSASSFFLFEAEVDLLRSQIYEMIALSPQASAESAAYYYQLAAKSLMSSETLNFFDPTDQDGILEKIVELLQNAGQDQLAEFLWQELMPEGV